MGLPFFPILQFFAIHFSLLFFSKKRMFFSQQEKDVLDSHQIKRAYIIRLSTQSETTGTRNKKPVGFSMDETSTRDALKAFVNREMSSVAVRSCCCYFFFSIARGFGFVKH